ncbi:hypothetical protein OROGR_016646 [Orobanche gracilis]
MAMTISSSSSSSVRCNNLMILVLLVLFTSSHYVSAKVAIYTGESLRAGGQLIHGAFTLAMQADCNLVLRHSSRVLWSTGTAGKGSNCYVTMQDDGNLVIYSTGKGAVWASKTVKGKGSYELVLQDDRNLVIYKRSATARKAIWDTKTYH